jgi:hypothetical protein
MNKYFAGGLLSVCSVGCLAYKEVPAETDSASAVGTAEQAASVCNDNAGVLPTLASLAVSEANYLRSWDPLAHFTLGVIGKPQLPAVVLSRTAEAKCAVSGGCSHTRALLALQNEDIRNYVDQNTFNPTTFREELKAGLLRQRDREADGRNNPARAIGF